MNKSGKDLVDLHIHTDASDGTWNIKETIAAVIKKNIKYFSITDHDTFKNSLEGLKYIPRNKNFILGSEISATYNGIEYHILAYGFNPKNKALNDLINYNQKIREKNNDELINYVHQEKLINSMSDYSNYTWDLKRGGWKSLNYLIDKNVISDLNSYFELVRISRLTLKFKAPEVVIDKIHEAGGYCILAHPSAYGENLMSQKCLKSWVNLGIDGIECYSPYLKKIEDASYYVNFCKDNNLMISGGSDCHGKFNDRAIGNPEVTWQETNLEFLFNNKK